MNRLRHLAVAWGNQDEATPVERVVVPLLLVLFFAVLFSLAGLVEVAS